MKTKIIKSENELIEELERDIRETNRPRIVFQAGHFPLVYERGKEAESFSDWGAFSLYSFELAARAGKYAKDLGKEVNFAILADDHLNEYNSELSKSQRSAIRNKLYKLRNGQDAILPGLFHNTLIQYGFSESNLIRSNHNKPGRENCLYFSEKVLLAKKPNEQTECAKAYRAFLDEINAFSLTPFYLMSFIPNRCTGNICRGVLERNFGNLDSSHISMQTEGTLLQRTDVKSIWDNWGALYRRDKSNG